MNKELICRFLSTVVILGAVLFVILSCEGKKTESEPGSSVTEKNVKNEEPDFVAIEPELEIKYGRDSVSDNKIFFSKYREEEAEIILALNRKDRNNLKEGDILIMPDTLTGNLMDYTPFPDRIQIFDSIPKTILIAQRIQAFALYQSDSLVRWGPLSSGKQSTPTPNGLHYGNYKAEKKISTIDPSWIMPYYFNFMNMEGIGVHQYALPGFPASHGCVRLKKEDAVFVYNWARQWQLDKKRQVVVQHGTPFMVFGKYDYRNKQPWLELSEKNESTDLLPAERDTLRQYVQRYFNDDRNFSRSESGTTLFPQENRIETLQ